MEQNKLPKNIRQIGEKEDWIRVYIEDYVHTYIQRLRGLQEGGVSGGVLLGKRQRINGTMHLFIRGAVVAEDPFWRSPAQTPGQLKAESSVYFPELEICGFFVSSRQDRSSEVDLVRIFETHFPSEYQILFNVRDQEEEVFSYSGHGLIRLAGYYIYYEKNEEMQSYIIRQESLRVLERQNGADMQEELAAGEVKNQSVRRSEKGGKSGKHIFGGTGRADAGKTENGGGRQSPGGNYGMREDSGQSGPARERKETAGKKPAARKKMQKGDAVVRIVSIAGIFILAFLLFSDQIKFSKINENAENSSGILSSILDESSAVPAGADSSYIETGEGGSGSSGTDNDGNSGANTGGSAGAESNGNEESNGSEAANGSIEADGNADGGGNSSESKHAVEGAGGTVDGSGENKPVNADIDETEGGKTVGANAYVFPMEYLVKKGDSLYSISERYYGDTGMVDAICLANQISDPSQLKYGTILTLPAR